MTDSKPSRIVVSLRVGLTLAVANVLCAGIIAWAWVQTRHHEEVVTVTGSATERIVSDLITWEGTVTARHAELQEAYKKLKEGMAKSLAFMKTSGIPEAEMTIGSAGMTTIYEKDDKGRETTKVADYRLQQTIHITSKNVTKVADISRRATELIEQGVLFESGAPEFLYTKLADLKIAMLAKATQDASTRATQICTNSGSKLGALRSAKMGVMQVNAAYSSEVSDTGVNDTGSYEKDVRAVISASFGVEK